MMSGFNYLQFLECIEWPGTCLTMGVGRDWNLYECSVALGGLLRHGVERSAILKRYVYIVV